MAATVSPSAKPGAWALATEDSSPLVIHRRGFISAGDTPPAPAMTFRSSPCTACSTASSPCCAEQRYMAMLERACKMLADQFIGGSVTDTDGHKCHESGNKNLKGTSLDMLGFYSSQSTDAVGFHGIGEELPICIHTQRADCSTESCLTSHESPGGLTLEGSPGGGKKRMLSLDNGNGSLIWGEAKVRTQEISVAPIDPPHGIARYGM